MTSNVMVGIARRKVNAFRCAGWLVFLRGLLRLGVCGLMRRWLVAALLLQLVGRL